MEPAVVDGAKARPHGFVIDRSPKWNEKMLTSKRRQASGPPAQRGGPRDREFSVPELRRACRGAQGPKRTMSAAEFEQLEVSLRKGVEFADRDATWHQTLRWDLMKLEGVAKDSSARPRAVSLLKLMEKRTTTDPKAVKAREAVCLYSDAVQMLDAPSSRFAELGAAASRPGSQRGPRRFPPAARPRSRPHTR
mmetsp:Transcript_34178/g.106098  ORF Transcript_34178/g.106098 Transcript_34178/m.106098 type:complete len:193 (-) Transcript_34178:205-783(-)